MLSQTSKKLLQYCFGIALIFCIAASKAGLETAAWFVFCGLVGYANAFYVIRFFVSLATRSTFGTFGKFVALAAIVCSALIAYFGYGVVLALTTAIFFLIDALVLRFN